VVAAFFAAVTWGLWLARVRGVVGATTVVVGLTLLVAVDGLRVNDAFVQTLDPRAFLEPDPNVQYLMGRAEVEPPFRVFSMMQNGQDVAPGMHGLELAAGHHPNDLARYREVIGMVGSGIPENLALFHPNVMRLLNVSYVLWPDAQYGELEGADPVSRTLLAEGVPYASVYPYPALPRARLVGEALVVGEDRTLAAILGEGGFDYDPARQTVLTEPPPLELAGGEVEGGVTWVERTPNRLVLEVSSSGPALLVLSENWFPAWMASVDGAPVSVLRADHTLRAVPVPEGTHRVEMWYESDLLRASAGVSAVCVLVLLGSVAWSLRASRRTEGSPG
jgi:hypothetical protein